MEDLIELEEQQRFEDMEARYEYEMWLKNNYDDITIPILDIDMMMFRQLAKTKKTTQWTFVCDDGKRIKITFKGKDDGHTANSTKI